eukprot:1159535-Pelagomonas_calceolata.AAC.8
MSGMTPGSSRWKNLSFRYKLNKVNQLHSWLGSNYWQLEYQHLFFFRPDGPSIFNSTIFNSTIFNRPVLLNAVISLITNLFEGATTFFLAKLSCQLA